MRYIIVIYVSISELSSVIEKIQMLEFDTFWESVFSLYVKST